MTSLCHFPHDNIQTFLDPHHISRRNRHYKITLISGIGNTNTFDWFKKRVGVNIQPFKNRSEVYVFFFRTLAMAIFRQYHQIAIVPFHNIHITLQSIWCLEADIVSTKTKSSKAISITDNCFISKTLFLDTITHYLYFFKCKYTEKTLFDRRFLSKNVFSYWNSTPPIMRNNEGHPFGAPGKYCHSTGVLPLPVVGCPFGTNLEYLDEDFGMVYSENNGGIRVFIDPNSMKQWDPVADAVRLRAFGIHGQYVGRWQFDVFLCFQDLEKQLR